MATEMILSKESSESEIKRYFNAVLQLAQSANEFPISLDEVWQLVYPRKDHAVRELTENFMQDVDYQVFLKNGENSKCGRPTNIYMLTVSCMEYFIARKVRPVFEVYRQVFHRVAEFDKLCQDKKRQKREPSLTTKVRVGLEWVKGVSELLNLNDSSKLLLLGKVAEPFSLPLPEYTPSKGVLKSASELLKEKGIQVSAFVFNQKAIEKGYLREVERNASHGQKKRFKSITEKGRTFGENQICPNNPNCTQPQWYEDKFYELLEIIGLQQTPLFQ